MDTRGGDNPTNALLKLVDVPEANPPSGVLLESQRFASEVSCALCTCHYSKREEVFSA